MAHPDPALAPPKSAIGLYLHVPFCRCKCSYCDFFSETAQHQQQPLVDALLATGDATMQELGRPAISTVYIGGGTPSVLTPDLLSRLLETVQTWTRGKALEFTVEANPETTTEEFLDICCDSGVTRLSLGLQTFQDRQLDLLARGTRVLENRRALGLLVYQKRFILSVDLLAGIPGQTQEELGQGLRETLSYQPDHVSLYSLTREGGTDYDRSVRSGRIVELDPEVQDELWLFGRQILLEAGYENYEVSNFALPGHRCRHNMNYWRLNPYLGLGPSAVSTLPGQGGRAIRLTHLPSTGAFLTGTRPLAEEISPKDFFFETMMMGLRLADGVPIDQIEERFGGEARAWLAQLWRNRSDSWGGRIKDGRFQLPVESRLLLNGVLGDLMDELKSWDGPVELRWG